MKPQSTPQNEPTGSADQVEALMRLFFRILRVCSVDEQQLAAAISAALNDENLVDQPQETLGASAKQHLAATSLVFAWRRDGRFADSHGNPKRLTFADGPDSFCSLCASTAPEYDPQEMLRYLIALGTIRTSANGELELRTDSVLACSGASQKIVAPRTVLSHLRGFLGSVEFNLSRSQGGENGRFERACYGEISKELVPIFERFAEVRGQILVDAVDDWLTRHKPAATGLSDENKSLVGIGAYVLVHDSNIFESRQNK